MAIVYDEAELAHWLAQAIEAAPGRPILLDRYIEDAFELDVDAVCDGSHVVVGGIMQHIEEAGVHSGDSACILPPFKISQYHMEIVRDYVTRMALAMDVKGLINAQFAIRDEVVYVLEANPRASRTVPFVSKATGVPLARIAAQVAAGKTLAECGFMEEPHVRGFFVKEVVLPFDKLEGAPIRLGPEMRSTGEVMGHAASFGHAFAKAEMAAGNRLPTEGRVFISVNLFDKGAIVKPARDFVHLGFRLVATSGTAAAAGGAAGGRDQQSLTGVATHCTSDGTRRSAIGREYAAGSAGAQRRRRDPPRRGPLQDSAADHPLGNGRRDERHPRAANPGAHRAQPARASCEE
jgi:carbamoyl-phosphate synthase large subunit